MKRSLKWSCSWTVKKGAKDEGEKGSREGEGGGQSSEVMRLEIIEEGALVATPIKPVLRRPRQDSRCKARLDYNG